MKLLKSYGEFRVAQGVILSIVSLIHLPPGTRRLAIRTQFLCCLHLNPISINWVPGLSKKIIPQTCVNAHYDCSSELHTLDCDCIILNITGIQPKTFQQWSKSEWLCANNKNFGGPVKLKHLLEFEIIFWPDFQIRMRWNIQEGEKKIKIRN